MFEVEDLKYKDILDISHLLINRNITCIVGQSGSGKTTLLRHFNRMLSPDTGKIVYNGEILSSMNPIDLRQKVVMLGQTPIIYSGTVEDNLQIGLFFAKKPRATKEKLKEVLKNVDLNQNLDNDCINFSGGEKQRICLARVLLMDSETYLLDEPSAALDKETERFIVKNLTNFILEKNKNLIMVTHSGDISNQEQYKNGVITINSGLTRGYDNA